MLGIKFKLPKGIITFSLKDFFKLAAAIDAVGWAAEQMREGFSEEEVAEALPHYIDAALDFDALMNGLLGEPIGDFIEANDDKLARLAVNGIMRAARKRDGIRDIKAKAVPVDPTIAKLLRS